jgi:hypothetical protein
MITACGYLDIRFCACVFDHVSVDVMIMTIVPRHNLQDHTETDIPAAGRKPAGAKEIDPRYESCLLCTSHESCLLFTSQEVRGSDGTKNIYTHEAIMY